MTPVLTAQGFSSPITHTTSLARLQVHALCRKHFCGELPECVPSQLYRQLGGLCTPGVCDWHWNLLGGTLPLAFAFALDAPEARILDAAQFLQLCLGQLTLALEFLVLQLLDAAKPDPPKVTPAHICVESTDVRGDKFPTTGTVAA